MQVAADNNGQDGVRGGSGALISDVTATGNGAGGIYSDGGVISNCTAHANAIGVFLNGPGTVANVTVTANTGDGIRVNNSALVVRNLASGNGAGASVGAGIHTVGNSNRIDDNHVTGGDSGIDTDDGGSGGSAKNVVVRNTVIDQSTVGTAYAVDSNDALGLSATPPPPPVRGRTRDPLRRGRLSGWSEQS